MGAPPLDPRELSARLRTVTGDAAQVLLHEPELGDDAWRYVKETLDSNWVSSAGPFGRRFEHALAAYTGTRHAVATVNGTSALHVALLLAGVRPGDEVLVPALTFVATANAVAYCGARPHFADVDPTTLGLCPAALADYLAGHTEQRADACYNRASGRRIAALLPMHTFGHPVELDHLRQIADDYGLALVEDAAESLGSLYRGRHTGTFGRLGVLSFNGNKIVTTGGGGAILTDDEELAVRARHLTTTAKRPHRWEYFHDELGFNYRMPDLNAALGLAQVQRMEALVARKRTLHEHYREALTDLPGAALFREPPYARSNHWLNVLLLDRPDPPLLEHLLAHCQDDGLQVRPVWTPLHRLPMYADCPRAPLPHTEALAARVICLPSSPGLVPAHG